MAVSSHRTHRPHASMSRLSCRGVAADDHVQVIFCSRTHSQLSQFVSELRRTSFAKRVTGGCARQHFSPHLSHRTAAPSPRRRPYRIAPTAVAPLASRAHLCIHDDVLALGSATRINDRCLELQQGSAASAAKAPRVQAGDPGGGAGPSGARQKRQGCPYFSRGDVAARAAARDTVLSRAMDVEELGDLGRASRACPYYAARDAAGLADVVAVPYAGVVSRKAREALGVRLQGSVVVLDEAHNAADAVAQAHCAEVTLSQAALGGLCLRQYLRRFQSRLSAGNRMQLTLLVRAAGGVASAIQRGVCKWAMETGKFAAAAGLEGVNFIRVARFVSESKVLFKVASYVERQVRTLGGPHGLLARISLAMPMWRFERQRSAEQIRSGARCTILARDRNRPMPPGARFVLLHVALGTGTIERSPSSPAGVFLSSVASRLNRQKRRERQTEVLVEDPASRTPRRWRLEIRQPRRLLSGHLSSFSSRFPPTAATGACCRWWGTHQGRGDR